MSLDALHTMLMGDQHTVVEIGLMRRQTNLEYTVSTHCMLVLNVRVSPQKTFEDIDIAS
jgi:hypothetical protein